MRISAVAFFMILTTVFLSGCGKDQMATLDEHGNSFYSKSGVVPLTLASHNYAGTGFATSNQPVAAAPVMAVSTTTPPSVASQPVVAQAAIPTHLASSWQWPVHGKVTQAYGKNPNGTASEGIVIAAAEGTPIHPAQAGEVAFVGNDSKNYGNIVIVRHADGDMTSYSHAQSILVKKGQKVDRSTVLGYVGQSGNVHTPQLHFAVREGTHGIDPLTKLPQQVASN